MFKFHFKKNSKDLLAHLILVFTPITLISVFYMLYSNQGVDLKNDYVSNLNVVLTIGFALIFQIYGSAHSFETLGQEFLTPHRNRLLATPTEPQRIITSVLVSSVLISFIQTCVVLLFSFLFLKTSYHPVLGVLFILLLSVILNQLLGTVILLYTKNVKSASAVTTLYGIVAPMIMGLYFPLPNHPVIRFFKSYGTPMSLAQTASLGFIENDVQAILIGLIPMVIICLVLYLLINPLSKRVVQ